MTANGITGKIQKLLINMRTTGYGLASHDLSVIYLYLRVKSVLLWFTEGKQSTEQPGVAVCR